MNRNIIKKIQNFINNLNLIGQPAKDLVPKEIKDKVKLYIVKAEKKTFKGLPFKGLNSKMFYISDEKPEKVHEDILKDMDTKEIRLVLNTLKNNAKIPVTFVRRKIAPPIAKLMGIGLNKDAYRAIIVYPFPIAKEGDKTGRVYIGVYGYESLIVA